MSNKTSKQNSLVLNHRSYRREKKAKATTLKEKVILSDQKKLNKLFPIVKVSELSKEDSFLQIDPKTFNQKKVKRALLNAIDNNLPDFRMQAMDPSINDKGKLFYQRGNDPCIDKKTKWWKEAAKKVLPSKNSRLADPQRYYISLGLKIKYLVERKGYTVDDAWDEICDHSSKLGNFFEQGIHELEKTGQRRLGKSYDLGNTSKLLLTKNGKYKIAGGYFNNFGDAFPLADTIEVEEGVSCYTSVGCIICDV